MGSAPDLENYFQSLIDGFRAMPKEAKKKSTRKRKSETSDVMRPLDPMRTGMPAQDSIVGVREMKRSGKVFRILKTDEIDEYEAPTRRRKKPGR